MSVEDNIIIIGAGPSGIAMACQLQRKLEFTNFEIYERDSHIGGTSGFNTFPGCAYDAPSHMCAFSFEPNPNWSQLCASYTEVQEYMRNVANKYDLPSKIHLNTEALEAKWDDDAGRWSVEFRDLKTGQVYSKTGKFLVMATGIPSMPNPCMISGIEDFRGDYWHSSEWNHNVSLKDKKVIVIGNGCSATQLIPAILPEVESLVQFVRSEHFLFPRPNKPYSDLFKRSMQSVPGLMKGYRLLRALMLEYDFKLLKTTSGQLLKHKYTDISLDYMRKTAPKEYHNIVLPKGELIAERRILDSDYLASLHNPKTLLTNDPCVQIKEKSLVTGSGKEFPADVLIFANGFQPHTSMFPLKISGIAGEDAQNRWNQQGKARAYMGSMLKDFPNMFILDGPNTTGHFPVLSITESAAAFAVKIMSPFLGTNEKGVIEVTEEAEAREVKRTQSSLKEYVKSDEAVENANGHDDTIYPNYQIQYWWKTRQPVWSDFKVTGTKQKNEDEGLISIGLLMVLLFVVLEWLKVNLVMYLNN